MEQDVKRVRALTGITSTQLSDDDIVVLLEMHDGRVYCAAAEAADRLGNGLISGAGVTAVEDISMDRRRVIDGWRQLADRLRARCEDEVSDEVDPGPSVVEFRPYGYGAPEAVEHG